MAHYVTGLFPHTKSAVDAVRALKEQGFTDDISIIAKDTSEGEIKEMRAKEGLNSTTTGAVTGGTLGVLIGLLTAATPVTVGASPLIVGGALIALWGVTGGTLGALTGGLIGALADLGLTKEMAEKYEERIEEGDVLVLVETEHDKEELVGSIMKNHQVEDLYTAHNEVES